VHKILDNRIISGRSKQIPRIGEVVAPNTLFCYSPGESPTF
jgi:hypothetical protein